MVKLRFITVMFLITFMGVATHAQESSHANLFIKRLVQPSAYGSRNSSLPAFALHAKIFGFPKLSPLFGEYNNLKQIQKTQEKKIKKIEKVISDIENDKAPMGVDQHGTQGYVVEGTVYPPQVMPGVVQNLKLDLSAAKRNLLETTKQVDLVKENILERGKNFSSEAGNNEPGQQVPEKKPEGISMGQPKTVAPQFSQPEPEIVAPEASQRSTSDYSATPHPLQEVNRLTSEIFVPEASYIFAPVQEQQPTEQIGTISHPEIEEIEPVPVQIQPTELSEPEVFAPVQEQQQEQQPTLQPESETTPQQIPMTSEQSQTVAPEPQPESQPESETFAPVQVQPEDQEYWL